MNLFDFHVKSVKFLPGLNIWAYKPVMQTVIDIGQFEDYPSNALDGFNDRLIDLLPNIYNHKCAIGYTGGFIERLKTGTWIGHVLEHVILELQMLAGLNTQFGQTRETPERGVYYMVFHTTHEIIGRTALQIGIDLLLSLYKKQPYNLDKNISVLQEVIDEYALGSNTSIIVQAAKKFRIPYIRPTNDNWLQFGYGKYATYYSPGLLENSKCISIEMCQDKQFTKEFLSRFNIPVSESFIANTIDDAFLGLNQYGNLAIKPFDSRRAHGVSLNISSKEDIINAFEFALKYSDAGKVLIEKFYEGRDHRVLVFNQQVIGISCGFCLSIVGDGRSSAKNLIEKLNHDLNLRPNDRSLIFVVEFDDALNIELSTQGVHLDTIIEEKKSIIIRRHSNQSTILDPTQIHPKTIEQILLTTKVLNLNLAGIDIVAKDIRQPLGPNNGVIIEVNGGPGFLCNASSLYDNPPPVGDIIVKHLIEQYQLNQFKLIGVAGTTISDELIRFLSNYFIEKDLCVGLSTPEACFIQSTENMYLNDESFFQRTTKLLMNRELDVGIIASTHETIQNEGIPLGYELYRFGIILDVDPEHSIHSSEIGEQNAFLRTFRTQVDALYEHAYLILNADNSLIAQLSKYADGKVIFLTLKESFDDFKDLIKTGDIIFYVQDKFIYLKDENYECKLVDVSSQLSPYHQMVGLALEHYF
jgi:cyanophycin synthetase